MSAAKRTLRVRTFEGLQRMLRTPAEVGDISSLHFLEPSTGEWFAVPWDYLGDGFDSPEEAVRFYRSKHLAERREVAWRLP